VLSWQSLSALHVFGFQLGAHDVAKLDYHRIGDGAHHEHSFAAHGDHARVAWHGEILGHVRLTGSAGFNELRPTALAMLNVLSKRRRTCSESARVPGRDQVQRGVG
jgi:hypothetical protein